MFRIFMDNFSCTHGVISDHSFCLKKKLSFDQKLWKIVSIIGKLWSFGARGISSMIIERNWWTPSWALASTTSSSFIDTIHTKSIISLWNMKPVWSYIKLADDSLYTSLWPFGFNSWIAPIHATERRTDTNMYFLYFMEWTLSNAQCRGGGGSVFLKV